MQIIDDMKKCTGCGLCMAMCESGAIKLVADDKTGFWYPAIDEKRCTSCGKCGAFCPECSEVDIHASSDQKIYALIAKDERIREASTSGGAFMLLAAEVLDAGGMVCGVIYDGKLHSKHILIDDKEELPALVTSKYTQSDMRHVYKEIVSSLKKGKTVLFCGTPCQTAAIGRYAADKNVADKLILVDLLCRGVPSPKALDIYLDKIGSEKSSRVIGVRFKEKSRGWHNLGVRYVLEDGRSFIESGAENAFVQSFVGDRGNLCVRDGCFFCRYKKQERVTDLTIGDFWGLPEGEWDDNKGTSVVFVNTGKGRELFEKLKPQIRYKEFGFFDVANRWNISAFSALPDNRERRERFWDMLEKTDYRTVTSKCLEEHNDI